MLNLTFLGPKSKMLKYRLRNQTKPLIRLQKSINALGHSWLEWSNPWMTGSTNTCTHRTLPVTFRWELWQKFSKYDASHKFKGRTSLQYRYHISTYDVSRFSEREPGTELLKVNEAVRFDSVLVDNTHRARLDFERNGFAWAGLLEIWLMGPQFQVTGAYCYWIILWARCN